MGQIGSTELFIILGLVILLFGARKLPEAARGLGRSLKIFKTEIQGPQDRPTGPEADDGQRRTDRESEQR